VPGRGSRFSFTVPLATPQLVDSEGDETRDARRETAVSNVSLATRRLVDFEGEEVAETQGVKARLVVTDTAAQVEDNP
jgi:hypothetical protein